jgi:hypothetical protein
MAIMVKKIMIYINGQLQYSTNIDAAEVDSFVEQRKKDLAGKGDISVKVVDLQ